MAFASIEQFARLAWRHPLYARHLIEKKIALHRRYRWLANHPGGNGNDTVPPPLVYRLVLTYKCNLRCVMCYEWGDHGWCKEESRQDMLQEIEWPWLERLFAQIGTARGSRPSFILIGGEPLLYSHFDALAAKLKQHRCMTTICTNGILLDRRLDLIERNPYLTWLISLDGPEKENDALRGVGVYRRVVDNIRRLQALPRRPYIGISFTVRPENVATMYDFCREMQDLGVDWVLLNSNWFLSEQQARDYESFMQEHFHLTPTTHLGYVMPYPLDAHEYERQLCRIRGSRWSIQISSYLKPEDVVTFVEQPSAPPRNTGCYKQWVRMDVLPEGAVAPCVLYPDLKFDGLKSGTALEAWNSPDYANFRALRREKLLPICSKCNAPYLYDPGRKIL